MQELHEKLGVRFPVYVLVTKADLIAGFNEFFGDLGKEERDAGLGLHASRTTPTQQPTTRCVDFGAEFAALEKRLRDR